MRIRSYQKKLRRNTKLVPPLATEAVGKNLINKCVAIFEDVVVVKKGHVRW